MCISVSGVSGNTFFEAVENSQHLPDKRPLISQAQTVQSTMKTTVTGSPNTESEQPSGVSSDRGGPTSGKNSTRHSGQINIAHTPNGKKIIQNSYKNCIIDILILNKQNDDTHTSD